MLSTLWLRWARRAATLILVGIAAAAVVLRSDDGAAAPATASDGARHTPAALLSLVEPLAWATFAYNASVREASELPFALLINGPMVTSVQRREVAFAAHGYVPPAGAADALNFTCLFVDPQSPASTLAVPAVHHVHGLDIVRHRLATTRNTCFPVNVLCTVPSALWDAARARGHLDVQLAGSWVFPPGRVPLLPREAPDPFQPESLTFCSSAIFFDDVRLANEDPVNAVVWHYWMQRQIEYIEYYRLLGVAHFVFYMTRLPHEDDVVARREMAYYRDQGLVTWVDFRRALLHQPELAYHGQNLAQNECLLRQSARWQYGYFADLDEIVVLDDAFRDAPLSARRQDLTDAFRQAILTEFRAALSVGKPLDYVYFVSVNMLGEICPGRQLGVPLLPRDLLLLPEVHWRMTNYSYRSPKYVAELSRMAHVSTHTALSRSSRTSRIQLAPERLVMFHYRFGVLNKPTKCQLVLNRTDIVPSQLVDSRTAANTTMAYDLQLSEGPYTQQVGPRVHRAWRAIYGDSDGLALATYAPT